MALVTEVVGFLEVEHEEGLGPTGTQRQLTATLGTDHPLTAPELDFTGGTALDTIAGQLDMYSPAEACYFYEVLVGIFRSAGIAPRYVQHLGQVHTILVLVRAGPGFALVPRAAEAIGLDSVVLRPMDGIEHSRRSHQHGLGPVHRCRGRVARVLTVVAAGMAARVFRARPMT